MVFMSIQVPSIVTPVISILFGIIVLLFPKILNYAIGLYLIIIGIIGLL